MPRLDPHYLIDYLTGGNAHLILDTQGAPPHSGRRGPVRIVAPRLQDGGKEVYFVRTQAEPGADFTYLGYFRPVQPRGLEFRTSAKSVTGSLTDALLHDMAHLAAVTAGAPCTLNLTYDGKCSRCRRELDGGDVERGRHRLPCDAPTPRRPPRGGWHPRPNPQPAPAPSPSPSPKGEGGDPFEGFDGDDAPRPKGSPDGRGPQPRDDEPAPPPPDRGIPGHGDGPAPDEKDDEGDEPQPAPAPTPLPDADLPPLTPAQASLARAFQALAAAVGGTLTDDVAGIVARAALATPPLVPAR